MQIPSCPRSASVKKRWGQRTRRDSSRSGGKDDQGIPGSGSLLGGKEEPLKAQEAEGIEGEKTTVVNWATDWKELTTPPIVRTIGCKSGKILTSNRERGKQWTM